MTRIAYAALVWLCILLHNASGSLIWDATISLNGAGLGGVPTILTVQSPGDSSTESGCVGWDGANVIGSAACFGDGMTGGDEMTGSSQTFTRTVLETGITSAGELRIVFNPSEPGGNSITLNNMVVRIFSPNGPPSFTSGDFTAPFVISDTSTGQQGWVFKLDSADVSAGAGTFGNLSNRIGLSVTATNATGGPETFFVGAGGAIPSAPPPETPEPVSFLLVGSGLITVPFLLRRLRRR